jgi:hypothetical protein
MAKAISIATALTIGISTFGVESAWIPNIVKRINFANSPNGSSSSEGMIKKVLFSTIKN